MIKTIFFDVDGTLLSHTINDIPASTLKTLDALHEKGILLFLASGRHLSELKHLPLHDYPFDGYITQTGQICYDRDFQTIFKDPIGYEDAKILAENFDAKTLPIVLLNEKELYINYVDDYVISVQKSINTAVPEIGTYKGEDLYGATVFGTGEKISGLISQLKNCRRSFWHDSASDIILSSAGKVKGIEAIMEHFNIRRDETMAFGDEDNDLDMIEYVETGIVMGNGSDNMKKIADYITDSVDDDGILNAVKHFGLI